MNKRLLLCSLLLLSASTASAQDLLVDGTTMTLGGEHRFDTGARHQRGRDPGADLRWHRSGEHRKPRSDRGQHRDRRDVLHRRGAGYQTPRCGDGMGPTAEAAGQGGCGVRDSGGGGAHFGRGGRGTKDCFLFGSTTSCQFPQEFEDDCGNSLNGAGTSCTTTSDCRAPSPAGTGS